jgi:ribosome-binding protein aMBF1 (putative translation factor)
LYFCCKSCNLATVRKSEIKRLYGLTVEEYEAIIERGCDICGKQGSGREIHLDHDHRNGKVRTALCRRCNFLLGYADDSPERLRAAADYIECWQRQHQPPKEQITDA